MNETVRNVVEKFNLDLTGIFGNRLLDIIVYGSSVRGGFSIETSDIDFIVLIENDLSNIDQENIQNLHIEYRNSESVVSLLEGRYIGLVNDKFSNGYYVGTNPKGWKPINQLGFGDLESAMILDKYESIYKTDLLNNLIFFDWNEVCKEIRYQLNEFLTNDMLLSNEAYKRYALVTAARSLYTFTTRGFISKLDAHDWIAKNYFDVDYKNPVKFLNSVKFEVDSTKSSQSIAKFEFYNFENLFDKEIRLAIKQTTPEDKPKGFVPAYLFSIISHESNEEVGFIDVRIGHNKGLYYGGNIGYTVYEKHRGHNYALKACKLIKNVAIKHNMEYLYVTCNPDNIASRRTCEKLGLPLLEIVELPEDNDMYKEGERQKCIYYWSLLPRLS